MPHLIAFTKVRIIRSSVSNRRRGSLNPGIGNSEGSPYRSRNSADAYRRRHPSSDEANCWDLREGVHRITDPEWNRRYDLDVRIQLVRLFTKSRHRALMLSLLWQEPRFVGSRHLRVPTGALVRNERASGIASWSIREPVRSRMVFR